MMSNTNWNDFTPVDDKGVRQANPKPAGTNWSDYTPVEAVPSPGLARSIGDSAIALGSGVTQGVKMITDVAGADNTASRFLGKATEALSSLESPYRQAEKQARSQTIKQADESGSTWEQVKAYTGAFAEAPIDTTLNALGTSAPTLAAGLLTGGGAAAGLAARAAQVGLGAAQGVGGIKGQIHEGVKQKHLEAGATEADATQRADAAQAYSGPNAGSIALGGALGAVAGGTGAESAVRRLAGQRVAAGAADAAAPGIVRSAARGVAHETPMEMLQGGQERYASNTALQGEGFDVPTMQGVVGQAALEGLASAPMGGGFGAIEGVARQGVTQRQGEGASAFAAGESRMPPESIKSVAAKAQWVRGWDIAQTQASAAPPPAPAADVGVEERSGPAGSEPLPGTPVDIAPSNWETGTSPLAQQIQTSVQSAQDLAAQAMKPSERMGLNPDDGAMSTAAVVAVDSGASDQMQSAQQEAAQAQEVREPASKPSAVAADPETGEVAPVDRAQELQQRLEFIEQQARANGGWDMQLVTARGAARAELAALNPSSTSAQSSGARAAGGSSAGPAPARPAAAASSGAPDPAAASPGVSAGDQLAKLETTAANAQARAADWSSREYKPNSKPLPKYEAAGGPVDVQEANEQRRLKEVVSAKTAASNARAQAETLRQQGNVQAQLAAKGPRAVPSADEVGAKAIAKEGAARRLKKKEQADLQAELDAALSTGDEPGAPDNAFARASEDAGLIPQNVQIQAAAPAVAAPPGASKKGPANVAQAPQAQQAKAQQPQAGGAPTARSAAAPGLNNATTTVNDGAQAAAPAGPQAQAPGGTRVSPVADAVAARRAQQRESSERWTRMTTAERQALAQRAPGLNAMAKNNAHTRAWGDLGPKVREQLAGAMESAAAPAAAPAIAGKDIDGDWTEFAKDSGTKAVPRAEMPQIKAAHRGAMTNFMNARGIAHREESVPADSLKPTQAEFSRKKVAQAKGRTEGDRSILVSRDGHVLDGHHQWLAAREQGGEVRVIRLDAPIEQLLDAAREFPSSSTSADAAPAAANQEEAAPRYDYPKQSGISDPQYELQKAAVDYLNGEADKAVLVEKAARALRDGVTLGQVHALYMRTSSFTTGDGWAAIRAASPEMSKALDIVQDRKISAPAAVREIASLGLQAVQINAVTQDGSMFGKNFSDADLKKMLGAAPADAAALSVAKEKRKSFANNPGDDSRTSTLKGSLVARELQKKKAFERVKKVRQSVSEGRANSLDLLKAEDAHRALVREVASLKAEIPQFSRATPARDAADPESRFRRSEQDGNTEAIPASEISPDLAEQLLRIMGQAPEISPAARAQAVAKVRKTVDAIRSAWANGPDVVVAFDMNDSAVPADARAEDLKQRSGGAAGAPEGFYWKGKTYLLASQLSTANDAARVLFHEALGHHGLRGAFGKDLDNILKQIATMRRADVDAKIAEYGLRATSAVDRRNAAEEVLAEMAQASPQLHFVKRAIAAIRNWLRANVPGFSSLAMSDGDIIQAFILPARRYVEQGAQPQGGVPALSFSRSAMKSVDANIARGRKAMAKALAERNTVNRAMFRNGLGWVDFVWGSEGVIKPSGRTKGAMGLAHLLEARQRKDGLAMPEVAQLLDKVVQTIASGQEVDRAQVGLSTRVGVEHESTIVWLTRREGSNAWIVTGYEKTPSDTTAGRATAASTHGPASLTRRNMEGAGSIVNEGGDENNPMFSRSKLADIKDKALEQIHQTLSHPGKVSVWDRSVGTMRNLAERVPAFKSVFEAAQQFIDDVSTLANEAADAAPRLLPRVDSWKDLKKQPISAADNKAVAAPVFEGTLMWGRDVDGTAVLVDSLVKKYANISADEKAQLLLRAGRLDDRVLKMWRGMPVAMYESNINARFESQMLKAGVVWTDSELKDIFKANDRQISLYREARAGIDKSIDITSRADMLRALGEEYAGLRDVVMAQATLEDAMKVITDVLQQDSRAKPDAGDRIAGLNNLVVTRYEQSKKLMDQGYTPLMRFGKYKVYVQGKDGESIYFGMYESQRESNLARLALARDFPGAKITQGTMSQLEYKLFAGITPETLEQFGNMLSLDSEGGKAQDKAFQEYLQLAKNNHSALKRMIHRKGTAGYSEDVGRVLASFVYSNARMAAGGLNAGTLDKAIGEIPQEQGELKDVAMGLRSYIQDPQEEGQAVRGMLFAQYLGGSLASAMVNMTQPFAVTLPWLSQYGGIKKAGAQMARALKDMGTRGFQYEKDLALALRAAEDDGTVSPQEVHQLMAQARGAGGMRSGDGTRKGNALAQAGNVWEKTKVAWGQPFALAEQFNRRTTFIASYRIAKDQGMDNPGEFARKAVLETQFLYSKANKMRWARGAVGGTLMTFKTYSVSYLELMHRMWNQGGPEGKRAVAWSMVMLMLMGGAGGLPFMDDAEDLIDAGGQMMGYNFSLKQTRKVFMQEWMGKELAEFVETGLSGLPGAPIDVSGRLGMGNLIPGTGLALSKQGRERDLMEIAGPAGDLLSRGATGLRKFISGDVAGAALEVSPTAVRNALKGTDMAATGMYKDTKGYKVLDTTLDEALFKAIGFQPRSVAEVQEANSFMQRAKNFYTQSSSEIKAQWADALFRKDDAALQRVRERLAAWNRNNPDQPIVVKMPDVWKKVREMGKDRTQRIADTAPKALRAQMHQEVAGLS